MKKTKLKELVRKLNGLKEKGIFDDNYDCFELSELPKSERIRIFKEIISLFDDFKTDGDSDGCYMIFNLTDDFDMTIFSLSDEGYHSNDEKFMNRLDSIYFDGDDGFEELLKLCDDTRFVNLTPHAINIITEDRLPIATFQSEGVARVATKSVQTGKIDGVPIFETQYGEMQGLPEPQLNTFYIVSMLCKQACPRRKDLLSPSQLIRDENGQPVGCLGLE